MFDWPLFLRSQRIAYGGPDGQGWVKLHCPLCGMADHGMHMNVHTRKGWWHCWRNGEHRGRTFVNLIQILLDCSLAEAREIVGDSVRNTPTDEAMLARLSHMLDPTLPAVPTELTLPKELRSLKTVSRFAGPFLNYLRERGYRGGALKWLIETYDLHYATEGPFAYRVVFPVRDRDRQLLTWTGRSIRQGDEKRYLALSGKVARVSPKQTLLGLPYLWRCPDPNVLVICEGPFDAATVECYGRAQGVHATCLFGLSMSGEQLGHFMGLRQRFRHLVLLLDSAARHRALRLVDMGADYSVFRSYRLPEHIKDPGELTAKEAVDLCYKISLDVGRKNQLKLNVTNQGE